MLRELWRKDDLRSAMILAVNVMGWLVVVASSSATGFVLLAAVLAAVNLASATFRFIRYLRYHADCKDIDHE